MVANFEIGESDYESIDDFPLKWRWTDERWNVLPAMALQSIQPLKKAKAKELLHYSLTFSDINGLIPGLFVTEEQTDASVESEVVQTWLKLKGPEHNFKVVVSWTDELAVLVTWEVFCKYWDDFCYPGSDDVALFPLAGDWVLLYDHAECFIFGDRTH